MEINECKKLRPGEDLLPGCFSSQVCALKSRCMPVGSSACVVLEMAGHHLTLTLTG
jgi:hypothetical protein